MKKSMMPAASVAAMALAAPAAVLGAPKMDSGTGNVERLLAEVRQELGRVGDDVRRTAEDALKQARETGDLTAETKAAADQALTQFHTLSGAVQKLEGKLEGIEGRTLDVEQAVAAAGGQGGPGAPRSAGQEVVQSDELKAWLAGGLQGSLRLPLRNAITSIDGSAGALIEPGRDRDIAAIARQRLSIRQLLNQATTESDVVQFVRQTTRANAAAPTAEGAPAPESSYGWTRAEANVRKIAHVTHASDEALADAGQLQALIDGELRYGLALEEEQQLLAGDGVGENLTGLIGAATAFVAAAGLPNATRIDRLRLGLLQVALANYAADGITLHPTDWAGIELLKDTTGRYVFGDPNQAGTPRLWGLDVVPTLSHSVGEWMCGNFFMAATIHDRQDTQILISSENATNFVDGMKTLKGTKRLTLAIKRAAALVTGDFTFV